VTGERGREIELAQLRRTYDRLNHAIALGCQSGRRELLPDSKHVVAVGKRIEELEAAQAASEARP
jgi:hypothetical protein